MCHIYQLTQKIIKRGYERVIRVNSQSGKGGASFIMWILGNMKTEDEAIKFGLVIKEESIDWKESWKKMR